VVRGRRLTTVSEALKKGAAGGCSGHPPPIQRTLWRRTGCVRWLWYPYKDGVHLRSSTWARANRPSPSSAQTGPGALAISQPRLGCQFLRSVPHLPPRTSGRASDCAPDIVSRAVTWSSTFSGASGATASRCGDPCGASRR
jgi:hypothetical protein